MLRINKVLMSVRYGVLCRLCEIEISKAIEDGNS